jgi:glycosyltransferase involved in cell wall biosynthesis
MKPTPKLSEISVFLPCYNEAKNLPILLNRINETLPSLSDRFEVIVVNDGSTDNTIQVIKELQPKYPHLRLVNHTRNLGYGMALRSGFKAARFEWIFFTDGDNQFDIAELAFFVPYTPQYNVIIGYRKKRAEGGFRSFNAKLFKMFIDVLFRLHVKDIDCAFKLFKASSLKPIKLHSSGAMISAELLYRLKKQHESFKQLPVSHYHRKFGTPTGNNPKVIIKAGLEAVKVYLYMKFGFKVK